MNAGQVSAGNAIAALAGFFLPGLGKLIRGRVRAALGYFILSGPLWLFPPGWLGHLDTALDAAVWKPKANA